MLLQIIELQNNIFHLIINENKAETWPYINSFNVI